MCTNIIQILDRRRISCWNWSRENTFVKSMLKRSVTLATILDRKLLHGHVILGFNHRGDCIISYHCHINFPDHKYWLYWWKFNIDEELYLISKFELFKDEIIEHPLYIVVYEDERNTYALGCRNDVLESKPCYVSLLPSQSPPGQHFHAYSIHFKFELLLPYPSVFVADIYQSIPGCLMLNTGVSFVCVRYKILKESVAYQDSSDTNFSTQHFVMATSHEIRAPVCNSSILMKVYYQNQAMVLLKNPNKLCNDGLIVTQTTLDVDSWISRIIPFILHGKPYDYQCLCDYDLGLIEIRSVMLCSSLWQLFKCFLMSSHSVLKYSITIIGQWHINSGSVQLISNMVNSSNTYKWFHTLSNIKKADERCTMPNYITRPLSNLTVFKGNSLQAISHPYLPLTLVL